MSILSNEKYWMRLPSNYPKLFDWHVCDCGSVIPVKDQKLCDMCWAIATTDCVAMGRKIKGISPILTELSSKFMLDYANPEKLQSTVCYPYGLKRAFKYMAETGVMREVDYPFMPEKWPCTPKLPHEALNLVKIVGFETIDPMDEKKLMDAIRKYPICGGVRISSKFKNLKGEIYEGPPEPNDVFMHAILIIGFGYEDNPDKRFWIFKNSYGTEWGNKGYGRIARPSSIGKDKEPLILRTVRPLFERNENALVGLKKSEWHRVGNMRFWKT